MRRLEICNHLRIERIIPRFCPFCNSRVLRKKSTPLYKRICYYTLQRKTESSSPSIRLFVCETYKIIISFCTCGDWEIIIRDQKKLNEPSLNKGFEFKL